MIMMKMMVNSNKKWEKDEFEKKMKNSWTWDNNISFSASKALG